MYCDFVFGNLHSPAVLPVNVPRYLAHMILSNRLTHGHLKGEKAPCLPCLAFPDYRQWSKVLLGSLCETALVGSDEWLGPHTAWESHA
jgi:hypothetical protein